MFLNINYSILKKPKALLLTTALVAITFNVLVYFHPENQDWIGSGAFSWSNLLRFLFLDQFLIELITTCILFFLLWQYGRRLKLFKLQLTAKAITRYLLGFLPALLLAFFIFNPFTQSIRYFVVEGLPLDRSVYLNDYAFNFQLYLTYLVPVLLSGYGILIANLVMLYNQQLKQTSAEVEKLNQPATYISTLITQDDWGEVPLPVSSIIWLEKKDRKYFVHTLKAKLRTRETISELESSLDPSKFVRINRSVIVNVDYILNYSFWENEKYILRLRDAANTEFTMSRERLNKVKAQLKLT